jgi:hypothetical protein
MWLRGNIEQSTFGKRSGWTYLQRRQWRLSCSSMSESGNIVW